MMPIVDPYVQLSDDEFQLVDYLNQTTTFHVLRLVAVQQPQSIEHALQELHYLHALSNTRGLGGFPNAIISYCDLTQTDALNQLIEHELFANISGVHFAPKHEISISWLEKLELLQQQSLSLDLTVTAAQYGLVETIASRYPALTIVVNMKNWVADFASSNAIQYSKQIAMIANHENVHLKITRDLQADANNSRQALSGLIQTAVNQLGYERLMFSSGSRKNESLTSFDDHWGGYVDATRSFTARQRENLFRLNAVRVYKL